MPSVNYFNFRCILRQEITMTFKDNFSKQADIYAKYRPHYSQELYAFLATLTHERKLAWDCGTGNGQAALGLAEFYESVLATDPSPQQIANCIPHPQIHYKVETAENSSIPSETADIITIANALHWFNHDAFYKEVNRVLKPGGVIAAWAYLNPSVNPAVNEVITYLHDNILGDYWLAENRHVENGYNTIPFPFQPISSPVFTSEKQMNLDDFIQFLNTWSATQRFINTNNTNPVDIVAKKLREAWGHPDDENTISWELFLKTGRK